MNIGSHLGQYRIVRKLGAGGMGTVYLAEHVLLGRRAAIKTLLPALSVQREIVDRFFNEARATSAISDPGVVQVFDFGYHVDGTAYIVMELLEGEALADRLDRLGKLSVAESLRIARQVAGSLGAAHACNIVHRDLKPENVFLIRDAEAQGGERTKILDFGICKLGADNATQTGTMLGTPVYMSPEQCQGAGRVDHRSDIYALGCVLFQMLTGRPPFDGEGAGEFIVAHMREEAPPPSKYVPELPSAVDGLLARCLAKSPDERFQSMAALQAGIESVLASLSAPGTEQVPVPPALALAPGFKSVYDGNFGTGIPTQDGSSRARRPSTLGSLTGEMVRAKHSSLKTMFAIVFMAVIAAMIATSISRRDEASAQTAADVIETVKATTPQPAAQPQPQPAAQPQPQPQPEPQPAEPPAPAPSIEPEPEQPIVEKTVKQVKKAKPKPRPTPARRQAPKKQPIEDLYETR